MLQRISTFAPLIDILCWSRCATAVAQTIEVDLGKECRVSRVSFGQGAYSRNGHRVMMCNERQIPPADGSLSLDRLRRRNSRHIYFYSASVRASPLTLLGPDDSWMRAEKCRRSRAGNCATGSREVCVSSPHGSCICFKARGHDERRRPDSMSSRARMDTAKRPFAGSLISAQLQ